MAIFCLNYILRSTLQSKLNLHVLAVDIKCFYEFTILNSSNGHVKFHGDLLIRSTSKLSLKIYFYFFLRFFFVCS